MKKGLSALLHPMSMDDFFSAYQSSQPFVIQHNADQIKPLLDLPFLSSLEALLQIWPSSIDVHLPDIRDEASSITTNAEEANNCFNQGMGLLFNEAQNLSPLLKEWLDIMRLEMGLSSMCYSRCLIYATPDGKGTAPHFDQNINFVLQIHGIKKWRMAPNQHVENPLTRHTMGLPADPEMMSYLESPLPLNMPADAKTYELKPGSLLFVPRGYWHETEAEGDALALNFTFTAPTWLDLFTAALRGRLALSPEWRKTADGLADRARFDQAELKFDQLLNQLLDDMPNWRATDILSATESD